MINLLIVGMGQIGYAIYDIYKEYPDKYKIYYIDTADTVKDSTAINIKNEDKDLIDIDIMHVCIPYNEALFKKQVIEYIREYLPALTIIDSTIDIGTTKDIWKEVRTPICYSPCMGVHPNLKEGILTFTKIVSGIDEKALLKAVEHFHDAKINVAIYPTLEDAEASKLMCTTYYGWNITFMKELHAFCEQYSLDFESVYTATNQIYNEGYRKLNMSNVQRPVLKYMPGKIGGHCVIPNCKILRKYFYPANIILEKDHD